MSGIGRAQLSRRRRQFAPDIRDQTVQIVSPSMQGGDSRGPRGCGDDCLQAIPWNGCGVGPAIANGAAGRGPSRTRTGITSQSAEGSRSRPVRISRPAETSGAGSVLPAIFIRRCSPPRRRYRQLRYDLISATKGGLRFGEAVSARHPRARRSRPFATHYQAVGPARMEALSLDMPQPGALGQIERYSSSIGIHCRPRRRSHIFPTR